MSVRRDTSPDPRVDDILDLLMQLAAGNLEAQFPHTGRGDVLDAIIESINMLAEELLASRHELEEAHKRLLVRERLTVMGQLCGGVAHELRNPLSAVKNAAYYLRMVLEHPGPEVAEILEIIEKEVGACERIIGGLLDYARPRLAGQVKLDVGQFLEEVLARAAPPPEIEVVRQFADDLPQIIADPGKLEQAFGNILRNAIHAIVDGPRQGKGRLVVATKQLGSGWIAVSVADDGEGVPKENLPRIFEPLFTTKAKGIGLGLAVTKTAIELHGGSIEVQSEFGKGVTMTVRLPTRPLEDGHGAGDASA